MSSNLTGAGTHKATAPGYAGKGIVPIGGEVPPGVPVGSWMEKVRDAAAEVPPPAPLSAFDHDGDGRPGGSLPGPRRRRKK